MKIHPLQILGRSFIEFTATTTTSRRKRHPPPPVCKPNYGLTLHLEVNESNRQYNEQLFSIRHQLRKFYPIWSKPRSQNTTYFSVDNIISLSELPSYVLKLKMGIIVAQELESIGWSVNNETS
ncbi:hypothetical protein TNIN_324761 [Trichonephila inaurata madagascariensis]|uniref:Uncharacterized protein n=1 Tax=Trichonephila inaurata madagascariensis TaxID=2747483 RepID=A0A8X7C9V1_9ARAC|nr:hypothetical protein TNIN_324761 [Trichonephila inaurata madagascariensis]